MKGIWIFAAIAGLLGVLAAFLDYFPFICLLTLFLVILLRQKNRPLFLTLVILAAFSMFLFRSEIAISNNKTKLTAQQSVFHIVFDNEIKVDGDIFSAQGRERNTGETMIIRYKIPDEKEKKLFAEHLTIGLTCRVEGTLEVPASATNPNGFDYQNYLNNKSIFWILKIETFPLTECQPSAPSVLSFFRIIRSKGTAYIEKHFPEQLAPISSALIFGDRALLSEEIMDAYKKLGIVHLLAISGLHVSMLAGMIFYAGIRIGITREKMTALLLVLLPCYMLLSGAAPSVIRAVVTVMLVLIAQKLRLAISPLDAISTVFLLYIFVEPLIIFDVGFQLSFFITCTLILSSAVLLKKAASPLELSLVISFICQVASIPIMFSYFYTVSVVSVFANLLYVPLFSVVLLPVIVVLFLMRLLLGASVDFFLSFVNTFVYWLDWLALKSSELPFAVITLGKPPLLVLLLMILAVPFFFYLWEKGTGVRYFFQISLLLAAVLFLHYLANSLSPNGEVTILDVGQGDSIFIQLPYGKGNYLIDAGGTLEFSREDWQERNSKYDVGKDTVLPFLHSKGVSVLDKLIITHGDADHMQGAFALIDELKVKEVIMPIAAERGELEGELLEKVKSKKIKVTFTRAGDSWHQGDAFFQVISPPQGWTGGGNDGSVVIYAKIGGLFWLFTGDLEAEGEETLIQQYPKIMTDVLKVGHHGSKTSTTEALLAATEPKFAIISAGRNNRYNHPHAEVVERLEHYRVKIWRTDSNGAITYKFRNGQGTFHSVIP